MKKTQYHCSGDTMYIDFVDYKIEHQLKDFYKLLKKASGYTVQEYKAEGESTIAMTSNPNSIRIAWNRQFGCHVYSTKKDALEFVEIVYKMLCYRYNSYGKYQEIFDSRTKIESKEKYTSIEVDSAANSSDMDIIADINELLEIARNA